MSRLRRRRKKKFSAPTARPSPCLRRGRKRSRRLLDQVHAEDQEEAIALHEAIEAAVAGHDQKSLAEAVRSLKELLFFVEGN